MATPFETAPGSLTDISKTEDQLKADLEAAKENENVQRMRADKLQETVEKLQEMLEGYNDQCTSPMKPLAAPRQKKSTTNAGDLLEKQNEKLEDQLATVREQMIVERQAARSANLSLWKMEKQVEEVTNEKNALERRIQLMEGRIKKAQHDREDALRLCKVNEEAKVEREQRIEELKQEISALKNDVKRGHEMREKCEQERMKCKMEVSQSIYRHTIKLFLLYRFFFLFYRLLNIFRILKSWKKIWPSIDISCSHCERNARNWRWKTNV